MRHLLADRDEEGKAFTWLDLGRVWSLEFALMWQPHGGGGSNITMADALDMQLAKAVFWHRAIGETREIEAKAIKKAAKEGRGR